MASGFTSTLINISSKYSLCIHIECLAKYCLNLTSFPHVPECSLLRVCVFAGESENTSPGKKKVHFAGDSKENVWPEKRVGIRTQERVIIKKLQEVNIGQVERNYPLNRRPMQGIR